jgi:hypothetical protein
MIGLDDDEAIAYGLTWRVTWDARVDGWRVGTRPDGRAVWVKPMMFTCAIIIGAPDDVMVYDDRWCYERADAAIAAARAWLAGEPPAAEPYGWHRHPSTGRRRPEGDPAREYVEH